MNKLVACAILGLGLTQVLVGCGDDDDDVTPGTSGSSTTGGKAGSPSGGSSTAGNSTGGKAGAATGGTAGKGSGGNATAGKAGSDVGGTPAVGGAGGAGGDIGEGGTAGESLGGAGGAGGAPSEPVNVVSDLWLSHFCEARSTEVLQCEDSGFEWSVCYSTYKPFLSTDVQGSCEGDVDDAKLIAMVEALDALAAACPDPDVDQWRCTFDGAPQPLDQACRDADDARRVATMACIP